MEAEPPSTPSSSGSHPCVVRPDVELLEEVLDQLEVSSFRDTRGRLGTRWPCFSLFFTIHDEDEVFSARTIYDHFFGVEDKPALCAVLDEWNRDTTGLKSYTATDDDGSVIIVSEAMMRTDGGVTREQFAASATIWLGLAGSFHLWLTQRLSLAGLAGEPL
ncbi:YbjN domain-containing protein [Actinoallomurus sp. NPDC052274]|uniref:YbjN domain-containing protein n=1 Tax=Actinoallomurus sp. NPDC052274 TaxID=3155420 RepID=UPI00343BBA98